MNPRAPRLWAVTPEALVACPVPSGATTVHELYDGLPLGVYSALRTFEHDRFLALEEHFDRTDRCLALLGWADRLDRVRLRHALHELVQAAPSGDCVVRFDFLASAIGFGGAPARTLVGIGPFSPVPERCSTEGVRVELTHTLERQRPLIKTAQFVIDRRPYPLGRQNAFEHVIVDRTGRLREGTSSNFYGVARGRICTAGDGVLEGVTRKILFSIARSLEIEVDLEGLDQSQLADLDEACLSSSTRGVVPIVNVGGTRIGDGRPGPVVQSLRAAYDAFAAHEARPAI